jgi:hypothetical protein
MGGRFILVIKRVKKAVPKFYHGEQLGFMYKARSVGWHRIPPFSLLPYLTGDKIQVHLSLKPSTEEQEWQTGIIKIEPPDLTELSLDGNRVTVPISDFVFPFVEPAQYMRELPTPPKYQFPTNKWWSRTLPLKGGGRFGQPCNFTCSLVFQNMHNDHFEDTASIRIADIEVLSRAQFCMWAFTTIVAITAVILSVVY